MVDYTSLDPRDRRLVIIASKGKAREYRGKMNWGLVLAGGLPLASRVNVAALFISAPSIGPYFVTFLLAYLFGSLMRRRLPYPLFDLSTARNQFDFPVNHPTDGGVYACCDSEPKLYVPLVGFHRYMYESKMSAFHVLCANLGVRRCTVVYAEEDDKEVTMKVAASGIPTQAGPASVRAKGGSKSTSRENATVILEYPRPKGPLIETNTGWMNGEPTWVTMQKLRLERDLKHYRAEFDYSSDMGVNADVATKVSKIGLDIGGNYQEMKRRKWVFDVDFWPRSAGGDS